MLRRGTLLRITFLSALVSALVAPYAPAPAATPAPPMNVYFPYPGYYRPGGYMPVCIATNLPSEPGKLLELSGDGVVTTVVEVPATGLITVPLLVLDRPGTVRWALPGVGAGTVDSLVTRLEENEVLIAVPDVPAVAPPAAAALFPGKRLVPVSVNSVPPPPTGSALRAWEVLDAVVFDAAPKNHDEWTLLAGGAAVIVRTDARPDNRWPWRQVEGAWVLEPLNAGPPGAVYPPAYGPAHALRPGQPATQRHRIVFIGAVVAILALAVSLWRSRYAAAGVVALSAAAAALLAAWGGPGTKEPRRAVGTIVVTRADSPLAQSDEWTYLKTLSPQRASHPWLPYFTRPALASLRHAREVDLRLHCEAHGPTAFSWRADPGAPMAFVTRTVHAGASTQEPAPQPSPLRDLARQAYLSNGAVIRADVWLSPENQTEWDEAWPSVAVRRGASQ